MASLLDGMTKRQKLKFLYIDSVSRNLVDAKTAEKDFEKEAKKLEEKKKEQSGSYALAG